VQGTTKAVAGAAGALLAMTVLAPNVQADETADPGPLSLAAPEPASEAPTAQEVADARTRISDLNRRLRALAPYVRIAPGRMQRFDRAAARAAGHDTTLLDLADDLVRYQNALLVKAQQARTKVVTPQVLVEDYPEVRRLFSAASRAAVAELREQAPSGPAAPLDLTAVDPCGDWQRPVPAAPVPRKLTGPYANVEASLVGMGYHRTAGHACGHPNQAACTSDYTRGRPMHDPRGVCASPRFRDQAIPSYSMPGYVHVQYGEPNPEFEAYDWPYWTWAAYVTWWHRRY
jgi:hypothetical protein